MKQRIVLPLLLTLFSTAVSWIGINALVYFNQDIDTRSLIRVMADAAEAGKPAVPSFCPRCVLNGELNPSLKGTIPNDVPLLLGSVPLAHNVYCQEDEGWFTFDADRFGFNNDDRSWEKPVERLVIGDSFAEGACSPNHLRVALGQWHNTISLGMAGNGPLLEYATLKEFFNEHSANEVVWLVFGNDFTRIVPGYDSDLQIELRDPLLRRYGEEEAYVQHYFDAAKLSQFRKNVLARMELFFKENASRVARERTWSQPVLSILSGRNLIPAAERLKKRFATEPAWPLPSAEEQRQVLEIYHRAVALSAQRKSGITFVFIPHLSYCRDRQRPNPYAFIQEDFQSKKIDYLDYTQQMTADCSEFTTKFGPGHFNSGGYQRLAQAIEDHLKARVPSKQASR